MGPNSLKCDIDFVVISNFQSEELRDAKNHAQTCLWTVNVICPIRRFMKQFGGRVDSNQTTCEELSN